MFGYDGRLHSDFEWEYIDFIYSQWCSEDFWSHFGEHDHHTTRYAHSLIWQTTQMNIHADLQNWLREGWQPVTEIGPAALKIDVEQVKIPAVDTVDVVLWLLTAGAALIVWLLKDNSSRVYTIYRPSEFRVTLRRPASDAAA